VSAHSRKTRSVLISVFREKFRFIFGDVHFNNKLLTISQLFVIFVTQISLRLRIISYRILREFGDRNASVKSSIDSWYKVVRTQNVVWEKPQDVVDTFGATRVDIIGNNRVIINLSGNDIRVVLLVKYGHGRAFVRWIGWHKDYTKLDDITHI